MRILLTTILVTSMPFIIADHHIVCEEGGNNCIPMGGSKQFGPEDKYEQWACQGGEEVPNCFGATIEGAFSGKCMCSDESAPSTMAASKECKPEWVSLYCRAS